MNCGTPGVKSHRRTRARMHARTSAIHQRLANREHSASCMGHWKFGTACKSRRAVKDQQEFVVKESAAMCSTRLDIKYRRVTLQPVKPAAASLIHLTAPRCHTVTAFTPLGFESACWISIQLPFSFFCFSVI